MIASRRELPNFVARLSGCPASFAWHTDDGDDVRGAQPSESLSSSPLKRPRRYRDAARNVREISRQQAIRGPRLPTVSNLERAPTVTVSEECERAAEEPIRQLLGGAKTIWAMAHRCAGSSRKRRAGPAVRTVSIRRPVPRLSRLLGRSATPSMTASPASTIAAYSSSCRTARSLVRRRHDGAIASTMRLRWRRLGTRRPRHGIEGGPAHDRSVRRGVTRLTRRKPAGRPPVLGSISSAWRPTSKGSECLSGARRHLSDRCGKMAT
jgi:hypothetical protein